MTASASFEPADSRGGTGACKRCDEAEPNGAARARANRRRLSAFDHAVISQAVRGQKGSPP
jgi:hypothetical protein